MLNKISSQCASISVASLCPPVILTNKIVDNDIHEINVRAATGLYSPFSHAGTINNLLTGKVIDLSSPSDTRLNCTFLPFFTGSAHCTVHYGTDSTYMNLPYSAESTETRTAGDTVNVVLRERLNSSTAYYYIVSAVSGDVTVMEEGSFTTPLYSKQCENAASDYWPGNEATLYMCTAYILHIHFFCPVNFRPKNIRVIQFLHRPN